LEENRINFLSLVKCECGFEILVVPNLAEMSRVIELHADSHARMKSDPITIEEEFDRVETLLTGLVLQAACKAGGF
jgi:hypothetical protein